MKSSRGDFSILFLVFFLLVIYGLFSYYMRTPQYTAHMIELAYKSREPQIIGSCIDLKAVVNHAYDDLTGNMYKGSKMPQNIIELYEQYYRLVKRPVCSGTVKYINDFIATGKWPNSAEQPLLRGRELGIDYEELLLRSLLRDTKVISFGALEQNDDGNVILSVTVKDHYTEMPFVLQLLLVRGSNGLYHVTRILNYSSYLLYVRSLCRNDIEQYRVQTGEQIKKDNDTFLKLQMKFVQCASCLTPDASDKQRQSVVSLINDEIIPAYEQHLNYLRSLKVPTGAVHLNRLRIKSTELTIKSWREYAEGISENNQALVSSAENIHKKAMVIEQKVRDNITDVPALFMPDTP